MKQSECYNEVKEYGNIDLSADYVFKVIGKENINDKISILDVGTNMGSLPYKLYQNGIKNAYGIDIRPDAIQRGKERYQEISRFLHVMTQGKLPYDSASFDYITLFDVIEHVPDVDPFLKEIYRVLKPGGKVIFQTPNLYINSIWETIRWRSFTEWKKEHCSLQTPKTLYQRLLNVGLSEIVIEKNSLISEFNKKKLEKYIGVFSIILLHIVSKFPMIIFPNMWGYASKIE